MGQPLQYSLCPPPLIHGQSYSSHQVSAAWPVDGRNSVLFEDCKPDVEIAVYWWLCITSYYSLIQVHFQKHDCYVYYLLSLLFDTFVFLSVKTVFLNKGSFRNFSFCIRSPAILTVHPSLFVINASGYIIKQMLLLPAKASMFAFTPTVRFDMSLCFRAKAS